MGEESIFKIRFSLTQCIYVLVYTCIVFAIWQRFPDDPFTAMLLLNNTGAMLGYLIGGNHRLALFFLYGIFGIIIFTLCATCLFVLFSESFSASILLLPLPLFIFGPAIYLWSKKDSSMKVLCSCVGAALFLVFPVIVSHIASLFKNTEHDYYGDLFLLMFFTFPVIIPGFIYASYVNLVSNYYVKSQQRLAFIVSLIWLCIIVIILAN